MVLADKIPDRTADIPLEPHEFRWDGDDQRRYRWRRGEVMAMVGPGPGVTKGPNLGMGGGVMGGSGRGGGDPIMERRRGLARKAKLHDMKPQIIP